MRIGRLEVGFTWRLWPKARWICPQHGEIHMVIYACPTCHSMVEIVPYISRRNKKAKIGGGSERD